VEQDKFSVTEAVFLVDRPLAEIQQAVDKKVIQPTVDNGSKRRRLFGRAELRYLVMDREIGDALSGDGKRRLYEEVSKLPARAATVKFGPVAIDLKYGDAKLRERIKMLKGIRNAMHMKNGEPFLKGTTIPAYQIAALLKEMSVDDILEDYPSLKRADVEVAASFALVYPKLGRPYPSKTLKRGISELLKAGVFDDPVDDGA